MIQRLMERLGAGCAAFADGYERELERRAIAAAEAAEEADGDEEEGFAEVAPQFTLEIVERANDRYLDRLGAIDALLVGVLAASLAIGSVVIDKYSDLGNGLWWLAGAYGLAVLGLALGNLFFRPTKEGDVDPVAVIAGFEEYGEAQIPILAEQIARGWKKSQWLRPVKASVTGLALVSLSVGTITSIQEKVFARAKVVQSHGYENRAAGSSASQQGDGRRGQAPHGRVQDQAGRYREARLLPGRPLDGTIPAETLTPLPSQTPQPRR